jgi:phosphoribosylanthranilate isomerase
MSVEAKICGLSEARTMTAAVEAGAAMVGLNFYPPSPRSLTPAKAGRLAKLAPSQVRKVGIFVDAADDAIATVLAEAEIDLLQLHGAETPARVAEIKARFSLPVMKAIAVAERADIDTAHDYEAVADILLFDAKAPKSMVDALPGGNGLVFDWGLLEGRRWQCPWALSGGLDADNVAEAVRISGTVLVDVSSGVERSPGVKDPAAIRAFLDAVKRL